MQRRQGLRISRVPESVNVLRLQPFFFFFLLLHQSILQRYEPEMVIVADVPPSHTSQDVLGKQHLRTTGHIIQSNLSANLGLQRACR